MSWFEEITEKAGEVIEEVNNKVEEVIDGSVLAKAGKIVGDNVTPETIQGAREAIGPALKQFLDSKPDAGSSAVYENAVYLSAGPEVSFDVKSDKTMKFEARSNAAYTQTAVITVKSPDAVTLAKTTFKGQGEGVTMKNERDETSWQYRIADASGSRVYKVSLAFYHNSPTDSGSPVASQATATINDCVGSAKSEDAASDPKLVDWNDTIITISKL